MGQPPDLLASIRLAAIVESSEDAIVSKDLDGRVTSWNRGAERLFGYTAAEVIGQSIRIIIPDDLQGEEDAVLARIRGGEPVEHFETTRRRKDGSLIPISLSVSPLRAPDGTVVGASKIARDISERRRQQAEVAAGEARQAELQRRLMALVEASGSLLVSPSVEDVFSATVALARATLDADGYAVWQFGSEQGAWRIGRYHGVSDRFAAGFISSQQASQTTAVPFREPFAVSDVSAEPLLGLRRAEYAEEGIRAILAVPLVISGQATGSLVFYYRRERTFSDVETLTARALGNLASAAITTAELYDEQQRRRRQADYLAAAGALLATSLDYQTTLGRVAELAVPHIADWCVVDLVGEDGRLHMLAAAHTDPVKVEMARQFRERWPSDPESTGGAHHVVRTGTPVLVTELTDEMLARGAQSPEHFEAMRALHLRSYMCVPLSAHGRHLGAITFVGAESGRRYTPADLQFAQEVAARAALAVENSRAYDAVRRANQLKDDFLATLSHELRTPLNALLGYARMLKSGMVPADRQIRAFEILDKNATALTQIVEDVLDVSRIVSGKLRLEMGPVELPPLLNQCVETVQPAADAKGVQIRTAWDLAPGDAVSGDPDRLRQVFWNLLANAVKFTPQGGRIDVQLRRRPTSVEVVVSDNGIGIDADFLPHVFERFRQADSRFSRQFGGLGLGLSIVRHLVDMHGGTIDASSEGPDRGATFRITLPLAPATVPPLADPYRLGRGTDPELTRLEGVEVLAVDDDEDALVLIREMLEAAGARVITATSASAALALLQKTTPDLLLTDIGMPGMDGFALIAELRRSDAAAIRRLPAIAVTAYARSEDRARALREGYDAHVAKPIDPVELLRTAGLLVRRPGKPPPRDAGASSA